MAKAGGCGGRALVAAAEHGLGHGVVSILVDEHRPSEAHLLAALNACGDVDFRTADRIASALKRRFSTTQAGDSESAVAFRCDKAAWVRDTRADIVASVLDPRKSQAADQANADIALQLDAIRRAAPLIAEEPRSVARSMLVRIVRSEDDIYLGAAERQLPVPDEAARLIGAAVAALAPHVDAQGARLVIALAPVFFEDPLRVRPSFSCMLAEVSDERLYEEAVPWMEAMLRFGDSPPHIAAMAREVVARGKAFACKTWAVLAGMLITGVEHDRVNTTLALCDVIGVALGGQKGRWGTQGRIWFIRALLSESNAVATADALIVALARIVASGGWRGRDAAFAAATAGLRTDGDRERFRVEEGLRRRVGGGAP